ncbi:MAG: hypothetical protein QOK39_107 [Acidimicrobiaceae bacterium]|jgi:hypothetical protein|nr:hypothetical protein [Acidimicrobiaceae bacterium]
MPADDLSSARGPVIGIDMIAGALGRFIRGQTAPTSSGPQTATFLTPWVEVSGNSDLRLDLIIAAATGTTPSMTVTVQTSFDAGVTDAARTVAAFAAQTAAGTTRQTFGPVDRWVRLSCAITGTTPSFTFTASGEAL